MNMLEKYRCRLQADSDSIAIARCDIREPKFVHWTGRLLHSISAEYRRELLSINYNEAASPSAVVMTYL